MGSVTENKSQGYLEFEYLTINRQAKRTVCRRGGEWDTVVL